MPGLPELSEQDTDCGSKSSLPLIAEPSDPSGANMMLFPPTPDNSPCNSPRFYFSSQPNLWLDNGSTDGAPLQMEQFELTEAYDLPTQARAQALKVQSSEHVPSPSDAECEKALVQLNGEDSTKSQLALNWVLEQAWPLAASPAGCRVVQRALDLATGQEQIMIAEQMRGHVRDASTSPHANHVLQKCVELLPPENLQFILDEMKGHAVVTARHRFGCRVLERLIEYCPTWQTEGLLEEVLTGASQLCRHTFGNFVVQHVLEHGTASQRHVVAEMLYADIQRLARHRVASHVVRAALVHCVPEDRQRLVTAMRADAGELADLAHHHCGSFVVREMRREMRR
mmetsp:Transcript_102973/g.289574  ORF Transcript_102973/g.289574 Transcript_102973/m.289574 type:complete len:341 (-) Transcript_102973:240-1262(-)